MAKNDTSPWNPITKEELLAFIGVNLAMGVVQLPLADDYWGCVNPFSFDRSFDIYMWLTTLRCCRDPILIMTSYGR